jgi:tetratricopeptide (TPR) repeat protein
MLAFHKAEYEKAANFLIEQNYLFPRNYYLMEALADVYLKWGEVDKRRLDDARLWYNEVLFAYGAKSPILYKLLNCFIHLDDYKEVDRIRRVLEANPKIRVDGDIFARMAGYLIDKGTVENIRETLFFALRDNEYNPNLHFQIARYFNSIGDNVEEEKALRKSLFYYDFGGSLTREEQYNLLEANKMLGKYYLNKKDYIASQRYTSQAANMYENLLDRNLIKKTSQYGEIYSNYGEIFYYGLNSYSTAYSLFRKAEENLFTTRELSFRKGYIKYDQNELDTAIVEIHKAELAREDNIPVMFSKANTLSLRGSYYAAISYYDNLIRLLNKMENEYDTLYPRDNDTHLSIIENYIRVYNNRGVTIYNLHGNRSLSEVGYNFTKSMEYYDYLSRDPDFLIRSDIRDLAYYNSRAVTYPDIDGKLYLYMDIPKDFSDLNNGLLARLSNLGD